MTPQEFRETRKRLRLTQAELGEALGLGTSTVALYERGYRMDREREPVEIPKTVRLAMAALVLGVKDYAGGEPVRP
ncbi:helix-turn-helix domain-containing protein [Arenibaculum pallidiluteum]|uniref:helix-turn-helix domain-containing protein n=1 Tax=Arenibaculum pallidiluteum TaxID=2812559 RepID=UPI001A956654|nr:helix-turn-helix domain-containing protein [Arenibaculum pallidiluteum]